MPTEAPERNDSRNPARNPGDIAWEERVNRIARQEQEGDFDDEDDFDEGDDSEGTRRRRRITNDNADEPEDTASRVRSRESSPRSTYRNNVTGRPSTPQQSLGEQIRGIFTSKKAPAIATSLLFGGGAGFTILIGGPSTMFGAIISSATNENNFSAAATHVRALKAWSHRIAGNADSDKVKEACQTPKSVKCASVTFSEKQVNDLKAADIDVETDGKDVLDKDNEKTKVGDRYAVEEMKVPDGNLDDKGNPTKETFKAGDDIETKLNNKPRLRTMLFKGFNPLTKVFFSNHYNNILNKSFKTHRGDKLKGEDEKGERQSMRESLGIDGVEGDANGRMSSDEREQAKTSRLQKVKAVGAKFTGKGSNAIGTACSIYNGTRAVVAAAKAEKILLLTRLFIVYASEMHRIMDGTSEPQHATFIGDNWNYSENEGTSETNPYYKTTASDAEGMKLIFHGQLLNLLTWSRKYMVGGSDALYTADVGIRTIQEKFPGGKAGLKTACKVGGSALTCVGPQALLCGAITLAMTAAGPLIAKGIEPLIEYIVSKLADLNIDDDTKGVELGNAFAAGAGLALGRMAQEVGLRPSDVAAMQAYRVATAETNEQIAMMYRDQAKATPFDASNQYSFLGTIAHNIYKEGGTSASIFGNISRMFSIIPASVNVLVRNSSANAAWVMEQNDFNAKQWQECPDPALQEIKVDGSGYCTPGFDMSTPALKMDIDPNQKFMIDGGYADPVTGQPRCAADSGSDGFVGSIDALLGGAVSDIRDPGDGEKCHKFAMYKKYCANRDQESEGPYGETTEAIESGSSNTELWRTAYYCKNPAKSASDGPTQEELDNFAAFTMDYGDAGTNTMMDENAQSAKQQVSGDCSQLAQQLLDSPNVKFQVEPEQRSYMEQTARDCTQTLDCGGSTQMSTKLLALLVKASQNYQITIGAQASGHDCDNGYHPVGQAVDINGVRKLGDTPQTMTTWDNGDQALYREFYDFLDKNSDVKLELGQRQCFNGSVPVLSNTKFVADSCNHIHVGVTSP